MDVSREKFRKLELEEKGKTDTYVRVCTHACVCAHTCKKEIAMKSLETAWWWELEGTQCM